MQGCGRAGDSFCDTVVGLEAGSCLSCPSTRVSKSRVRDLTERPPGLVKAKLAHVSRLGLRPLLQPKLGSACLSWWSTQELTNDDKHNGHPSLGRSLAGQLQVVAANISAKTLKPGIGRASHVNGR